MKKLITLLLALTLSAATWAGPTVSFDANNRPNKWLKYFVELTDADGKVSQAGTLDGLSVGATAPYAASIVMPDLLPGKYAIRIAVQFVDEDKPRAFGPSLSFVIEPNQATTVRITGKDVTITVTGTGVSVETTP